MADFILQATLSNLLVSAILAAIAWFIQKRYRAASLANLLWIMVLIKMITPPLFAIPLLEVGVDCRTQSGGRTRACPNWKITWWLTN